MLLSFRRILTQKRARLVFSKRGRRKGGNRRKKEEGYPFLLEGIKENLRLRGIREESVDENVRKAFGGSGFGKGGKEGIVISLRP